MSMLAEARRKQKWVLNPRGKQWSEDSNKFGQKMLEKMGWTSGKGLGANEQGMTDHVRVSFKNDTAGIGFKMDDLDKAWTEHQDSFNEFLQKLQQDESNNVVQVEGSKTTLSGKSLELKSKQSRARVHYQKFTRGKDINKYSSKDLANIFGQKELNINKSVKSKEDVQEGSFDEIGTRDKRGGVITINGGNMAEYFMKKGQKFSLTPKSKKQQDNDSESEPEYVGFGFASANEKMKSNDNEENKETKIVCNYAFENPCVELNSPENISNSNSEYKSSKKRKSSDNNELNLSNKAKKLKENADENKCKNGIVNAGLNLDCRADEVCNGKEFEVSRVQLGVANSALDLSDEVDDKKKVKFNDRAEYNTDSVKKKKISSCDGKEFEVSRVQFGVTNSALDLSDETNDKKRVTFNDHVEYSTDSVKKKKGRTTLDKFEVENKKAKKKKHSDSINNPISSGFVNEALDVVEISEEVNDNEINERKSKKSKKRKGSRRSNLETIVEIPEEDKSCGDSMEIKRSKVENNTPDDCIPQEGVSSKKKKKKKHKEKIEVVNEEIHGVEEILSETNTTLEKEVYEIHEDQEDIPKRKKKKKKKNKDKDTELDLENNEHVISEINNVENIREEITEAETAKVKKKKKTKKHDEVNDLDTKTDTIDEKEISDKENTKNVDEGEANKSKKKKHKTIENESANNNSTQSTEFINESTKQTNTEIRNVTLSSKHFDNRRSNISSPWNHRARMSKRLLKSLFHRNSIQNFPGSNMDEIKGYGADVQ